MTSKAKSADDEVAAKFAAPQMNRSSLKIDKWMVDLGQNEHDGSSWT